MSTSMTEWAEEERERGILSEDKIQYILEVTEKSQVEVARKPPEWRAIWNAGLNPPSFEVLQEEIRKVIREELLRCGVTP